MSDVLFLAGGILVGIVLTFFVMKITSKHPVADEIGDEVFEGNPLTEEEVPRGADDGETAVEGEENTETLVARIKTLEEELRRQRRMIESRFRADAQRFETIWEEEDLPVRVHDLREFMADEDFSARSLTLLEDLADRLVGWIDRLGLGTSEIHHRLGLWFSMQGEHTRALDSFRKALQKGGGVEATLAIGDTCWELGKIQKARDAYRELLRREDMPEYVRMRFAEVAIHGRNYREGLAAIEDLLSARNPSPDVIVLGSFACGKLGNDDRAVELCERGLRENPDSTELMANMIIPLARMGQFARAVEVYEKALESGPENAEVFLGMGVAFMHEGKDRDAVRVLRKALKINPDYPEALFCMGMIHNRKKEFEKALDSFKKAVAVKPDYAEAYLHMKESYEGLRDFDNALAMLNRATQLDPGLS